MEYIYLLRAYDVGGYGLKRIESEFLFSTLEPAIEKISHLSVKKLSYRFEVLQCELNCKENKHVKKQWFFDQYGMPITISTLCSSIQTAEILMGELFSIGRFVIPQVLSQWDFSHLEILPIGVISEIIDGPCPIFVLDYINDLGFLERDHFKKHEMFTQFQIFNLPVPPKHSFLIDLSNHYRNIQLIDEKLLRKIYNGEVFLFNIASYY